MAETKKTFGGMVGLADNVEYRLYDKLGNPKKLFDENRFGLFVLKTIRKYVKNPINEFGAVKGGLFNHLAAYGLRIPFLTGNWGYVKHATNGITNAGRAVVSGLLNGSGSPAAFTSIGQGTGSTAFSTANTALGTGVKADGTADGGVHALASGSTTVSLVTTSVTNDTAQWTGTISETASIAVTESGVFNANTNGTMLCRQTFSAINVVSGDSLALTWKVQNT